MHYRSICLSLTLLLTLAIVAGASTLSDLSRDMAAIAKQASPASVQIEVERGIPDGMNFGGFRVPKAVTKSVGSGFIIDASGYVLTSADVVWAAKSLKVSFSDGSTVSGTLAGSDPVTNCALIKVDKTALKALTLGDSDDIQPGMLVVTVNSQAGMSNSVSLGVVAATDREACNSLGPVLQISGTIGPGASGGAVLDTEGRVVGITFAMFSPTSLAAPFNMPKIFIQPSATSKGAANPQSYEDLLKALASAQFAFGVDQGTANSDGTKEALDAAKEMEATQDMLANMVDVSRTSGSSGFAIPINQVKPIIELLKNGKPVDHAALGMRLEMSADGLVVKPSTGSPADKAGVKEGDILMEIDGRRFQTMASVTAYITSLRPGDKVKLVVRRGGREMPITVAAGSRSEVMASWPNVPPSSVTKPRATREFSLLLTNADIEQVAKALSEASAVSVVVVNPESIRGNVTIHLKSTSLDAALPLICDSLGCKFVKSGTGYVIRPLK